jgi:hypothetical protein
MSDKKSVLVVGLDPTLIDFSKPGYPPGMTAECTRTHRKPSSASTSSRATSARR